MKYYCFLSLIFCCLNLQNSFGQAQPTAYLQEIQNVMRKEWPNNRTINLVFHGHSVPSGYVNTPVVNTFSSYPYLLLKVLKEQYPYAVINVIITAIGGENSVSGQKRFATDVLPHKPDVIFIDYALNDLGIGLKAAEKATEEMIKMALEKNIKVILLTPSPDQRINLLAKDNELELFSKQIIALSRKHNIGVSDSYNAFKQLAGSGDGVKPYMGWVNHPNEKGNQLIANELFKWFK